MSVPSLNDINTTPIVLHKDIVSESEDSDDQDDFELQEIPDTPSSEGSKVLHIRRGRKSTIFILIIIMACFS